MTGPGDLFKVSADARHLHLMLFKTFFEKKFKTDFWTNYLFLIKSLNLSIEVSITYMWSCAGVGSMIIRVS